jgi:FixJ family two-component response regulator
MLVEITAIEHHPPVIMITGHGDEELEYLSFRMGVSGYAAKDRTLSVMLPDAVEWAMADARLKSGRVDGEEDDEMRRLHREKPGALVFT